MLVYFIIHVFAIGFVSAVPLTLMRSSSKQLVATPDCSSVTVHDIESETEDLNLHIPYGCIAYEFSSEDATCDHISFPMTCTWTLVPITDNSTLLALGQSVISQGEFKARQYLQEGVSAEVNGEKGKSDRSGYRYGGKGAGDPGFEGKSEWAAKAIGKSILHAKTCKPATVGKPPMRHFDCDMCWAGFVPYPCNCNCRGWTQVANLCAQPCSHRGAYSHDSGLYCHKPCDQDGQMALSVGCGLGHDRVCVDSTGDCVARWVDRLWSFADLLMLIGSGGSSAAITSAVKTAAKSGAKAALIAAKKAIFSSARNAAAKVRNKAIVKKALKDFTADAQERILETGATMFLTANLPSPSIGAIALEIAKLADPTGMVSLGASFVPPSSCEDLVCKADNCPPM